MSFLWLQLRIKNLESLSQIHLLVMLTLYLKKKACQIHNLVNDMKENVVFQASKVFNSDQVSDISESMKCASYFFRETTKYGAQVALVKKWPRILEIGVLEWTMVAQLHCVHCASLCINFIDNQLRLVSYLDPIHQIRDKNI